MRSSIFTLISVFCLSFFVDSLEAIPKSERGDELKHACLASAKVSKMTNRVTSSEAWCQCRNDYFSDLLTDADWDKYTYDYFALGQIENNERYTPPNSYARKIKIGQSHCAVCSKNSYQGCLKKNNTSPSTANFTKLFNKLRDGAFEEITRNNMFKYFFRSFVMGYSAYCGDKISNYIDYTVTSTAWEQINHVWWKGDTTVNKTRIDQKFFELFKQYRGGADYMLDDLAENKTFSSAVDFMTKPVEYMQKRLSRQCDTLEVQAAYENLYRFSTRKPAFKQPVFVQRRAQDEMKKNKKLKAIYASANQSFEKAKIYYTEKRRLDALKQKKEFNCRGVLEKGKKEGTRITNFFGSEGDDFLAFTGSWRGVLGSNEMELVTWSSKGGQDATGLAYFPNYDCLMTASVRSGSVYVGADYQGVASLALKAYSPRLRQDNCLSIIIDHREREIHYFSAFGWLRFDSEMKDITWYASSGKLSKLSPQSCDNVEVKLSKTKLSPAFHAVLKTYKYPNKRSLKMPVNFLEENK